MLALGTGRIGAMLAQPKGDIAALTADRKTPARGQFCNFRFTQSAETPTTPAKVGPAFHHAVDAVDAARGLGQRSSSAPGRGGDVAAGHRLGREVGGPPAGASPAGGRCRRRLALVAAAGCGAAWLGSVASAGVWAAAGGDSPSACDSASASGSAAPSAPSRPPAAPRPRRQRRNRPAVRPAGRRGFPA